MPKILKLSPYCYPEQVASSHLTKDLDEALVGAGFTIENYVPSPCRGVDETTRERYRSVKCETFNDGGSVVYRFAMFAEGKNPIQRAVRYLLVNAIQLWKGLHAKGVDVIYSGSTPPTQGVLCGLVKRVLRVPYIYALHDVFPDSFVNAGMTSKGSLLWRVGRKMEDFTYQSADVIIAISNDIRKNVIAKGVPEEKVIVIPNWIDTDEVLPVPKENNPLFDELDVDRSKQYVVYAGNIGMAQNVEIMVDAAERLIDKADALGFLIFGAGACERELKERINVSGLNNIHVFPLRPVEQAGLVYAMGMACAVPCRKGYGTSAMPSKTWTIMATGTPVLCSYDDCSDLQEIVEGSETGLFSAPEDVDSFCENITALLVDEPLRESLGMNARRYVEEHASRKVCMGQYVALFKRACRC